MTALMGDAKLFFSIVLQVTQSQTMAFVYSFCVFFFFLSQGPVDASARFRDYMLCPLKLFLVFAMQEDIAA